MAKDYWFNTLQINKLLAVGENEETRVQLAMSLFSKINDSFYINNETLKPHFIMQIEQLSSYGLSMLVNKCGYSPLHFTGHYSLDLSIDAEREKCMRLLTYDFLESLQSTSAQSPSKLDLL